MQLPGTGEVVPPGGCPVQNVAVNNPAPVPPAPAALQARLLPQPTDLSCFNWATNRLSSCPSANFEASRAEGAGLCVLRHSR